MAITDPKEVHIIGIFNVRLYNECILVFLARLVEPEALAGAESILVDDIVTDDLAVLVCLVPLYFHGFPRPIVVIYALANNGHFYFG